MLGLAVRLLPVWQWIKRNPLLLALVLCACWGLYQRNQAAKWQDRAESCQMASQAAAAQTKAMRERERAEYQEKAVEADRKHSVGLADARLRTDRYIRANRVQPSGNLSTTAAVDQAGNPADAAPVSSAVIMDTADVQTCGDLYAYAVTAHDWIASVGQ